MQKILAEKKEIRARCLALRAKINKHKAAAAAEALIDPLLAYIPDYVGVIAGYWPMKSEMDVMPALKRLAARGYILCLPVIAETGAPLVFRHWKLGDAMTRGKRGVRVPRAAQPEIVPDLIIAPLVAFDGEGNRLGLGAGFYDRTIRALRDPRRNFLVIGAAYAIQQVERVPADAHDEKLDAVVTENGVTVFP